MNESTTKLLQAAKDGDLDQLNQAIRDGAVLNEGEAESGNTALHLAASHSHLDVTAALLTQPNININQTNNNGDTALMCGARIKNPGITWLLLANKANIDTRNKQGNNALFIATYYQRSSTVGMLLKKGAKDKKNNDGNTALSIAIKHKLGNSIIQPLKNHQSTSQSRPPQTTGSEAGAEAGAEAGQRQVTASLIDEAAQHCKPQDIPSLACELVSQHGLDNCLMQTIVHARQKKAKKRKHGPKFFSQKQSTIELLKSHLEKPEWLFIQLLNGMHTSKAGPSTAEANQLNSFLLGLDDPTIDMICTHLTHQQPDDIHTHVSSMTHAANQLPGSKLCNFLKKMQDTKLCDKVGHTPLLLAAQSGLIDTVSMLASHGNMEDTDIEGYTPLLMAAKHGHTDTVMLLMSKGTNKEATDIEGYTPLLMAAKHGQIGTAELLVAHGANTQACDLDDNDALSLVKDDDDRARLKATIEEKNTDAAPKPPGPTHG